MDEGGIREIKVREAGGSDPCPPTFPLPSPPHQNLFRSPENEKPVFLNSLVLKSVFESSVFHSQILYDTYDSGNALIYQQPFKTAIMINTLKWLNYFCSLISVRINGKYWSQDRELD